MYPPGQLHGYHLTHTNMYHTVVLYHAGTVRYAQFYTNIFIGSGEMFLTVTLSDRYLFDERKVAQRLQCAAIYHQVVVLLEYN